MSQVFICYRRDDTSGHAGRLREFLARRLGAEKVFMDLWSLGPGADFIAAIEEKVGSSEALIALIGKHWLDLRGATGNRRLEDSEDAVRLEIATALRRGIRVIPVLVEGAAMPPAGSLPPDLAPLVRLNALNLGNEHWDDDCRRLLQALTPPRIPRSRIGFRPALAALALALAILVPASPRPREILPAKADVPILGILPFENLTGDPAAEWLGGGLATLLTDTLTSSNNVAVVSARRMAALYSAGQDESSLRRIAAAAGIRYLLTGHVESGPTSLKLVIRLQAIGTDREKTWTLYGSPKSLLGKGGEIVAFARQGMGLAPLERVGALAADFYTSNLEAYRDYVAGLQALQEYRYEEAARSFRAALQEEPGFTVARYRLAQTFAITGRTREALQLIRQAEQEVRGLSGREAGYIRAAALYFSRDSGAIEAYRKLVESFPYDIEAHQLRAQVLSESGLYEDALREWNVMRNLEPDLYTTWNFLGDVYLRTGKFDEAVRYLRQSLALDARRPDTRETLGNAYRALGRFDAAAAEY
ncbi:MAG TPA: tetratricopeptide repeat protein, partial [Thermoanaerobaculia bacterium]